MIFSFTVVRFTLELNKPNVAMVTFHNFNLFYRFWRQNLSLTVRNGKFIITVDYFNLYLHLGNLSLKFTRNMIVYWLKEFRQLCCFSPKALTHTKDQGLENIWRSPSLSELTPIVFNMELTHLASEVSICHFDQITQIFVFYFN